MTTRIVWLTPTTLHTYLPILLFVLYPPSTNDVGIYASMCVRALVCLSPHQGNRTVFVCSTARALAADTLLLLAGFLCYSQSR